MILYPALEANSGPGEDIENEGLYLVNINVNDGRTVPQTHSVLMFRGEQDTGNGVSRSRTGSSRSSRSRCSLCLFVCFFFSVFAAPSFSFFFVLCE